MVCLDCSKSQRKLVTEERGSWRFRNSSPSVKRVEGVPRESVQSTEEGEGV